MKWRLSLHGAVVVVVLGTSSLVHAQVPNSSQQSLNALAKLTVANERSAGFRAALFGKVRDTDGNGCDSREDVLRRDAVSLVQVDPINCTVLAGSWISPIDGATLSNMSRVAVGHTVTLREAWKSGAWKWSAARRGAYMNDVGNVHTLAVMSPARMQIRGDRDPATWFPDSRLVMCNYLDNWIAVKLQWGLSVDVRERNRVAALLQGGCITKAPQPASPSVTQPTTRSTLKPNIPTLPSLATTSTSIAQPLVVGSALAVLQLVRVENEYSFGYDRALFEHWRDIDGDGCDSRDQVLKRDSISLPQVDPVNCNVIAGDWISPYDGARWSNPTDIDIDHVVALKEAWDSGAWAWSAAQRKAFANDTTDSRTLLAVTDSVNQSKSDRDPSNWLPPLQSYTCTYLGNWVAVKVRWNLSMDSSEFGRIRNILQTTCASLDIAPIPNLPNISGGASAVIQNPAVSTGTIAPLPTSSPTTTASAGTVSQISPGSYCAPEGATGYYTLSGSSLPTTYVCSKTNTSGVPYSDGRARWRRA